MQHRIFLLNFLLFFALFGALSHAAANIHGWSKSEIQVLRSLWIESLPPLPPNPSNAFADNPKAAELGKKLFFDIRFSANQKVSCGTCHKPDYEFTDDLPLGKGMGIGQRRSMPLAGVAYSPWLFWDGRKDSLWSQALGPIENSVEHGITRTSCVYLVMENYGDEYEALFGLPPLFERETCSPIAMPSSENPEAQAAWDMISESKQIEINMVYANIGKAIEAYVRQILPGSSRFDKYIEAIINKKGGYADLMNAREVGGLRIFIGKANCINCHNGPLFSNFGFHNVGTQDAENLGSDKGRAGAIGVVQEDVFNCLGPYSDADKRDCSELRFMDTRSENYEGAFKTPSLRNVANRPPYMHVGQFADLFGVLSHYNSAASKHRVGSELFHGVLSPKELEQLEAFLHTLSGPVHSP